MTNDCYNCYALSHGTARFFMTSGRRRSCGQCGDDFVADGAEPIAVWEMELIDGHVSREVQPARYRVEIVKPLGSVEVGTYSEEEYQGMRTLIEDNNKGHNSQFRVVKITPTVVKSTSVEYEEETI